MKNLFLVLVLLSISTSLFASTGCGGTGSSGSSTPGPSTPAPSCATSPPAGNTCLQATPICDLNGYCGSTASSYTADYWCELGQTFCGSSIENNSFLSFVASASTISFNIWVTGNSNGIQLMVFSAAGNCSGAVTSHACYYPGSIQSGARTITATGLTPGNTYYIMIDGNGGAVCNYVIGANSGIATPLAVTPATTTICAGQSVNLTASGGNGSYSWTAASGLSGTSGATVTATPPGPGTYTYTVNSTSSGSLCAGSSTSATATVTVNPCGCTITAGNSGPICPGGTFNLTASTVTGGSGYSWTGPNGYTSSVQNPTGLTAPSTPGSYTYTVTSTLNGVTCTSSTTVVVNAITVDAGPDQTVCAGQSVTPNATGATTYSWDNGLTNGTAFTPTATTTYTVTGTSGTCSATDQMTVTVNPLPVVNAGNDVSVCAGTPVTLTGSGGTPSWNNGVSDGIPFTPTATATYLLTGTLNGCSATDQVVVTVNPLPIANAGPDQAVCAGTPVTLNGSGGTPSWSGGITNGTAFTPSATTTYTLTVTDANNCTATDQVTVTVNPTSVVSGGQDITVCQGTQVTLTATGGTGPGWNNGVINGVPFTPPLGTTTYTVTDNNPTGCSGSDQVVVTVNPNPVVSAGSDALICQGSSVVLLGSPATITTFSWDNGVVNGVPYTPTGTATYTVTGTDANGCQGTDQVVVTMTPTPVVAFTPSVTSGCVPLAVTFTNTNPTNNTYQWTLGNGATSTSATSASTVYTSAGCYDVTLISTTPNGCVGQATFPAMVCVFPNPVADFTPNPAILSLLDATSTMNNGSTGATTYQWNFGDGYTSTLTSPVHTFPSDDPGTYQIKLTVYSAHGCWDTAYVNIEVQDELIYYVPNSFTPDNDEHNPVFKPVFTSGFDPFDYKLSIFNRWGEIVFESNDAQYGWDGTYTGSDGLVQDGTYTWKIEFKTKRSDERKLVVGSVTLIR